MRTPYTNLLKHLRTRGMQNTFYDQARRLIGQESSRAQGAFQQYNQSMMRTRTPQSAKAAAFEQSQEMWNQTIGTIMTPAIMADQENRERIQDRMAEVEMKEEEWVDQEKKRRKAEKEAKQKGLWKVGLNLAGAALAPFTGGSSMMIASAAADIGGGLGLFGGEANPEEMIGGLTGMAQGVMSTIARKQDKRIAGNMIDIFQNKLPSMSAEGTQLLFNGLSFFKDPRDVEEFLGRFPFDKYLGGAMGANNSGGQYGYLYGTGTM